MLILSYSNQSSTDDIYTLSLHDALPISRCCSGATRRRPRSGRPRRRGPPRCVQGGASGDVRCDADAEPAVSGRDRKSTRLNSSHVAISYAVFCLKKKKLKENLILYTINE